MPIYRSGKKLARITQGSRNVEQIYRSSLLVFSEFTPIGKTLWSGSDTVQDYMKETTNLTLNVNYAKLKTGIVINFSTSVFTRNFAYDTEISGIFKNNATTPASLYLPKSSMFSGKTISPITISTNAVTLRDKVGTGVEFKASGTNQIIISNGNISGFGEGGSTIASDGSKYGSLIIKSITAY